MMNAAPAVENVHAPIPTLIAPAELQRFGINFSRAWLWRLARQGQFPSPLRLSGNRLAYVESEIRDWIASRPRGHVSMTAKQKQSRVAAGRRRGAQKRAQAKSRASAVR